MNQLFKIEFIEWIFSIKSNLLFFIDTVAVSLLIIIIGKFLRLSGLDITFSRVFSFFILVPIAFCLILVPGRNIFYPYDLSSVFLFSLCLLLLYQKKYLGYYITFVLATFNRETSCFLVIIFLFTQYSFFSKRQLFVHLACQTAIWVGIKYLLYLIFANNEKESSGSSLFVFQLIYNLGLFKDPWSVIHILGSNAFFWLPVLLYYKRIKDEFIRKSLWIIPILYLGMLLVGVLTELRIFNEINSVLIIALAHILHRSIKENSFA